MKRQRDSNGKVRSAIINVGSVVGYAHGGHGFITYCAAKAFALYYTVAQYFELNQELDI